MSKTDNVVLDFMREIHKRSEQLARSDDDDDDSDDRQAMQNPAADSYDVDMEHRHGDKTRGADVVAPSSYPDDSSPDVYVEKIARNLLQSCHPPVLSSGVSQFPKLNPFGLDEATRRRYNNFDNENENGEDDAVADYYRRRRAGTAQPAAPASHRPYQHRRTDYLRRLLRVMAPMALEVGASVCSTVLSTYRRRSPTDASPWSPSSSVPLSSSSSSSSGPIADEQVAASIILFAHWLPVAPQLVPMVTEFFACIPSLPWSSSSSHDSAAAAFTGRNGNTQSPEEGFVVAEALHILCYYFYSRNETSTISRLSWDWTFVFGMLHRNSGADDDNNTDTAMKSTSSSSNGRPLFVLTTAIQWYAVRILAMLLNWNPRTMATVVERWQLVGGEGDCVDGEQRHNSLVPCWQIHPWEVNQEELEMEQFHFQRRVKLWRVPTSTTTTTATSNSDVETSPNEDVCIDFPSADVMHDTLLPCPYLTRVGRGVSFYQEGSLTRIGADHNATPSRRRDDDDGNDEDRMDLDVKEGSTDMNRAVTTATAPRLVPTITTVRNLSLLGAALCEDPYPPPILVCGPHGSGKSSLIRELCRMCRPHETLMEFHIDDETDSKTLIGSYTTTDIPGEFTWRPGALTHASREGRWILLEDFDSIPIEIQAALVKLFEERMLPLGNGKYERAHPSFRIFATCTTRAASISPNHQKRTLRIGSHRGGGKQILNPSYWRNIHVKPLPYPELREVAMSMFGTLPESVIDSSLMLMRFVDRSGRTGTSAGGDQNGHMGVDQINVGLLGPGPLLSQSEQSMKMIWFAGRLPSVRDFFKLLSRISNGMCFETNVAYLTETQRTLCMAESVDTFLGACSDLHVREEFVCTLAAPVWGISKGLALDYMKKRKPTIISGSSVFQIGRAKIDFAKSIGFSHGSWSTFAETNHSLRLMESIAVCVRENEPVLLVGETGCGKTTVVQQLATYCERKRLVQNLSLQTDSTDLLGGYRPLEIRNTARHVYEDFVDTFVASFSRKQNIKFLEFAASMLAKSDWKRLSQCFQRAAQLGAKKMRDMQEKGDALASEGAIESWRKFARNAERFERQRTTCDAGIAFEFAEGALVDALRSGKW
jgi:energy-coupling factor transporter ATP-binding protein EcfA2